ncbi:MAG: PA0069 family radical SAM protein [Chitinophagales bacterium]|nr:PA0069 family radical SAM protein [Chitinophagaceae bacterium]MCB9065708.1 PA0069 family radical SAM protein [Chitinophagales bacterium]
MINQKANHRFDKGRGAQFNPKNKYLVNEYVQEHVEGIDDWEMEKRETEYIFDDSRTIVNKVTSPDVGMMFSANPYQGCEHGCIYCYARNSHEYWGYSAGVDFESRIVVKRNAPALLKKFFENKNWTPAPISLSGNTDCYQPIERRMRITRKMLEICLEYRNPVGVLTKNALVLRDLDILQELNKHNLVSVFSSITSLDEDLRRVLEPRTASYKSRLKVVEHLSKAGIPTGIMNAPIIPGLNDNHMHDVLKAASEAGAKRAGYTVVRLNGAIGPIFHDWLHKAFPDRAEKVWNLISDCHEGKVNDSRWGNRIVGDGKFAELIKTQFQLYCNKFGLNKESVPLNTHAFRRMKNGQLPLF